MENFINLNALKAAMDAGYSSNTLHDILDDTIMALKHFGKTPSEYYAIVPKVKIDELKEKCEEVEKSLFYRLYLINNM